MADLARYVAGKLGLVAADKTGLNGIYDFEAEWTVESVEGGAERGEALQAAVFAALRDQLGFTCGPSPSTAPVLRRRVVSGPSRRDQVWIHTGGEMAAKSTMVRAAEPRWPLRLRRLLYSGRRGRKRSEP